MKRLLCWDLDEHLGIFDNVVYEIAPSQGVYNYLEEYSGFDEELEPRNIKPAHRKIYARAGIEETLQRAIDEGFKNVITTSARLDYAKKCIELAGISRYFQEVFSFHDEDQKDYGLVAREMGLINHKDNLPKMIVLGNKYSDAPFNFQEALFILDKDATKHHAGIIIDVLSYFLSFGNEKFLTKLGSLIKRNKNVQIGESTITPQYLPPGVLTLEVISSPICNMREINF